jgi:hypothetical protein
VNAEVAGQLDLFGEVEAAESVADARRRERAEWSARFERAPWVAPYDTAGGMKKGESKLGWRCPDPGMCSGRVERLYARAESWVRP